ncbi:unnamed protein product [Lepeophtheirus salmonis]|uniref:(salmon louse) hypothetical protein n=1 Tax=Lepeophtheirus salmonis TaxID=72036 RepID=A0A7R8H9Q0_LEPSM|nr:unnamed protein product [Lepeophtheirus salmonis]CAF2957982.1 unnamed protein product [Lepeophtheirus salmonis]
MKVNKRNAKLKYIPQVLAKIKKATEQHPLASEIPLLLAADTLDCWISPLDLVHISLDNLDASDSSKVPMLTPSLVRTPVQRVALHSRTPNLKPSTNSSLPVAWITGPATDPNLQIKASRNLNDKC